MMMSDSHLPPFGLRWTNIFQRLNNHFSLKAPSHTGGRFRLNKETCWTFKPQITKLRLVHNTMKQMQDSRTELGKRAGGLITQEVRFLLSNGLHREKSQAGICKPRFNTEKEQLCLNVSSSSRKPDFSVTHEDSWCEQLGWRARKSELVDLGNKLFWEVSRFIIVGLPLLLDHRNLKAWQRRWVSSLITKFDAGFRLYKAVTLQKRWISLISLPADLAIQCHSCLY